MLHFPKVIWCKSMRPQSVVTWWDLQHVTIFLIWKKIESTTKDCTNFIANLEEVVLNSSFSSSSWSSVLRPGRNAYCSSWIQGMTIGHIILSRRRISSRSQPVEVLDLDCRPCHKAPDLYSFLCRWWAHRGIWILFFPKNFECKFVLNVY